MKRALIVVDMQNDFIDGSLGTAEAKAIVPAVQEKIAAFDGPIFYTRDTHTENYLSTQEGKNLPVVHCVRGTHGWQIADGLLCGDSPVVNKPSFGSMELASLLQKAGPFDEIELIGLCTDICVISNAVILKAAFPETIISVDASCCAGVTPESHKNALSAMKMCQIEIH